MGKYLVFDCETETHHSHKRKSNPFDPRNYVVLRGWKKEGDTQCSYQRFDGKTPDNYLRIDDDVDVLVGHNIKFDLLYEMANHNPDLKAFFKRGGRVWCSQYCEYLLNAQQQKYQMNSMDDIAESYGGRTKVGGLKAMWDAGILTSAIDPDLLLDYLIGTEEEGRNSGDIGNTEKIYLGQIKAAEELGMTQAIRLRMDGLCATTDMEYNGLKIDMRRAKVDLARLTAKQAEVKAVLDQYTAAIPAEVGFNWNSRIHASCILYGGTIKYEKQDTYLDPETGELARKWEVRSEYILEDGTTSFTWDGKEFGTDSQGNRTARAVRNKGGKNKGEVKTKQVRYKGELKVKYQEFFYELPGYTEPDPDDLSETTDGKGGPIYSTAGEVIERLAKRDVPFLKALGQNQDLNKEIGTYYIKYDERKKQHVGMLTCVQPSDWIVHHSLNHCSTITSRLSSNNPNMQNLPRADKDGDGNAKSEIKALFVSRFGDDGEMVEADYSQLEVVVQGLLSLDKALCRDLIDKIDFHCKRVALKHSISYQDAVIWCKDENHSEYAKWKKERTKAKIFSFQRAYGAGATLIAAETGMDIEEVKDMIAKEDAAYPGVVKFNQAVENECTSTAEPFRDPERGFRVFRRGTWQAPTGTVYTWRSYDAPAFLRQKGITDTFKPTELKNYPVQGTGGEIVQIILGLLWRWFVSTDNFNGLAFLVNTVHDCVWADTHKSVRPRVANGIKVIMESVPAVLKRYFNIDCPVPFPVEVECGPNMLELKHC